MLFLFLAIFLVISNYTWADDTDFRVISVFVLAFNYMNMIMYLRFIDQTAVLVAMLYSIISDMLVFTATFIFGIIAFANMFYVMQGVAKNEDSTLKDDETEIVGSNFALACLHAFDAAFGNFDTGNFYKYGSYQIILWAIYFCLVIVLTLVMLNMIIALMGGTYAQFESIQSEE